MLLMTSIEASNFLSRKGLIVLVLYLALNAGIFSAIPITAYINGIIRSQGTAGLVA